MHSQRREQQDDQDKGARVHDAGNRTRGAVADVRCSPGQGPCHRETAEERRHHVGDALADEFLVGVVTRSGCPIGDDGGQQGFDGTEHRDREGGPDELDDLRGGDGRPLQGGQSYGNATERAADRGNAVEPERRLQQGGNDECDQRPWHAFQSRQPRRINDQEQRQQRQRSRDGVKIRECLHQLPELFVEVPAFDCRQPEKILPFPHPDDYRDTGRETHDDRIGNVLDDRAQPRDTEQEQHQAGHQRGNLQAVDAMIRRDAGEDGDEGAGRARDLQPGPAQNGHDESADDRRIQSLFGFRARGDGKRHGERQCDDADDNAGNDVRWPMLPTQQAGTLCFEEGDHEWAIPR